jgi:glycosyltransferase involved in cell wall biosynthesis
MASYNGAEFIEEQLRSILGQLSDYDEVVVSDDSSTDATISVVEKLASLDPRIVLLKNRKFKTISLNFENALRHARGQYIFLADQDDVWLPSRVSATLPFLERYDLVVCDCRVVDKHLNVLQDSYFQGVNAGPGFLRNLFRTSSYIGCCMAFRREVMELALPFPKDLPIHDFWIAMLAEVRFRIGFLRKPLILYRRHGANASATSTKSKNSLVKKAILRWPVVRAIPFRLLRKKNNPRL